MTYNSTTLILRFVLGIFIFCMEESSVSSLSLTDSKNFWNRRTAIANLATFPAVASLLAAPAPVIASIENPSLEEDVTTVVIGSPDVAALAGLQFKDVTIGTKTYPVVKSVQEGSIADSSGVKEGMLLLGKDSATKAESANIESRIRTGPYPFVMQFYNPKGDTDQDVNVPTRNNIEEPLLDPYGRLLTKTVRKSKDCTIKAKRGDMVEISYEARINSQKGPLYDSTAWRGGKPAKFVLGKGFAIAGVDIGLNDMCIGEVRELDIPTQLGYGKFGSQVFDVPGDKRLWWRVELLDLTKGKGGSGFYWDRLSKD